MALINLVWSCVSGDEDEDDMAASGRYKNVSRVQRSRRGGDASISANEKRQYLPLHNTEERESNGTILPASIWPIASIFDSNGNAKKGGGTGGGVGGSSSSRRSDVEGASNGYIVI